MKALNTVEIDGHIIITSTGPAEDFIDPIATENKIAPMLAKSDVQKQIDERLKQIATYTRQIQQSRASAKRSTAPADLQKIGDEIKLRQSQIAELQAELIPLNTERNELRRSLVKSEAVYFKTPERTTLISDADAELIEAKLSDAAGRGFRVKADKTEIADLIGKTYWKKTQNEWFKFQMLKLGDTPPAGAILDSDLDDEQRSEISAQDEIKRIQSLKSADKETEKQSVIEGLIAQANAIRSKLEITGGKDALKTAQDWYKAEVLKVEQKYA